MKPVAILILVFLLGASIYSQREVFFKSLAKEAQSELDIEKLQQTMRIVAYGEHSTDTKRVPSGAPALQQETDIAAYRDGRSDTRSQIPPRELKDLVTALGATRDVPDANDQSDVKLSEDKWIPVLLAVAVVGYEYKDEHMAAYLLSVGEYALTQAPITGNRDAAMERFYELVGVTRYLAGVCYSNLEELKLSDRNDFYRALMIGYNAGPGNLLRYGLEIPFEEVQAYIQQIEPRMKVWQERIETEGLLYPERVEKYRSLYAQYRPEAQTERASVSHVERAYKPAQTREDIIHLVLSVAICYYHVEDPFALAFFLSLVQAESNFDPKAKSWAQARGIGQLLDRTAKDIVPWVTEDESYLYDPFINLHLSMAYIQYLGKLVASKPDVLGVKMPQDFFRAIMIGYNSGPGNLLKYKLKTPFKETQNYIRHIEKKIPDWHKRLTEGGLLRSRAFYEQIYGENRPPFVAGG